MSKSKDENKVVEETVVMESALNEQVPEPLDTKGMAEYQSHKRLFALVMTLGKYNDYRGWEIPKDEDPAAEGYLVIYNRDTEDHYESWSPKHIFDEGNTTVESLKCSVDKSLGNTDVNGAKKNVSDLVIYGNGDLFKLVSKASSQAEGWMKSTKVMNLPNGCVVQVTTQQRNEDGSYAIAEAVTFAPGNKFVKNPGTEEGGRFLPI